MKYYGDIDLQNNKIQNVILEKTTVESLSEAPTENLKEGQQYWNTTEKKLYIYNKDENKWVVGGIGPASTTEAGAVIIGDNIDVDTEGKISINYATTEDNGVVEFATDDESKTAIVEDKVINPKQLISRIDEYIKARVEDKRDVAEGYAILNSEGKIPINEIPDYLLGKVLYGGIFGTDDDKSWATITYALQTKLGISDTIIKLVNLATDNTSVFPKEYGFKTLEGTYFISKDSFDLFDKHFEKGDWLISTGISWAKIDTKDAVTGVKGEAESSFQQGDVIITRAGIGLGNVDNTSDINKPVSTATQNALNAQEITDSGTNGHIIKGGSTDIEVYKHYVGTAKSEDLYKVAINDEGHVTNASTINKDDIYSHGGQKIENIETTWATSPTNDKYPSSKLVKDTLDTKVTKNVDISGATHTKITYDSKGLVTSGTDLTASDIPLITLSKISDVTATASEVNVLDGITATTTELNYTDGVTSNIQTQLNSKQDTTELTNESDVVAAALLELYARIEALEKKLSPNGNLGKVNIDDLSVIKTFNNYTV